MINKNNPIIVGAAQFTQRKNSTNPLDTLSLIEKTCHNAIKDTQCDNIVDIIDAIYIININTWSYEDAPLLLGKRLKIDPKEKIYFQIGGQSPQFLVNKAAKAIASKKHRCVLIAGGEAAYSIQKTFKGKPPEHWPEYKKPNYIDGDVLPITDYMIKYELNNTILSYSIFETSLRSSSGRSIEEHKKYMGDLFEQFSMIASKNPYSWSQDKYTAEEIVTPSPENRLITHTYTKRMCANNFVDQAGAVLITSEDIAESLNIDRNKWIYIMGGASFNNIGQICRRPKLNNSPATKEGTRLALEQAGLVLGDINKFDMYSCFPSIVEIFMKELGIKENDPRDLTLTGGLPFNGCPLSNYSLLAVINTVNKIRKEPSLYLMVIANGGYNTKQSIGIYGKKPPIIPWGTRDDSNIQKSILNEILDEPVEKAYGKLTVEGYTVVYNRSGEHQRGIVIGILEKGNRCAAYILKKELLDLCEKMDIVGRTCQVQYNKSIERNIIISIEC